MSDQVITVVNGRWHENCYIVHRQTDAVIIDPGSQPDDIAARLEEKDLRVHAILNTHGHFDHIGAVAELTNRFEIPFFLHKADERLVRRANLYRMVFESPEMIRIPVITHDIADLPPEFELASFRISWLATPGHTEGGVCLRLGNMLFSGDTLMRGGVGRTDLPGANRDQLLESLRKLSELPPETEVYGGHGPSTTIGAEFSPGAHVWSLLQ